MKKRQRNGFSLFLLSDVSLQRYVSANFEKKRIRQLYTTFTSQFSSSSFIIQQPDDQPEVLQQFNIFLQDDK
jgi:hypothetical protein